MTPRPGPPRTRSIRRSVLTAAVTYDVDTGEVLSLNLDPICMSCLTTFRRWDDLREGTDGKVYHGDRMCGPVHSDYPWESRPAFAIFMRHQNGELRRATNTIYSSAQYAEEDIVSWAADPGVSDALTGGVDFVNGDGGISVPDMLVPLVVEELEVESGQGVSGRPKKRPTANSEGMPLPSSPEDEQVRWCWVCSMRPYGRSPMRVEGLKPDWVDLDLSDIFVCPRTTRLRIVPIDEGLSATSEERLVPGYATCWDTFVWLAQRAVILGLPRPEKSNDVVVEGLMRLHGKLTDEAP